MFISDRISSARTDLSVPDRRAALDAHEDRLVSRGFDRSLARLMAAVAADRPLAERTRLLKETQ